MKSYLCRRDIVPVELKDRHIELRDEHSTSTIEVRVRDGKLVVSAPNGGELSIAVKSHNAVEIGVGT